MSGKKISKNIPLRNEKQYNKKLEFCAKLFVLSLEALKRESYQMDKILSNKEKQWNQAVCSRKDNRQNMKRNKSQDYKRFFSYFDFFQCCTHYSTNLCSKQTTCCRRLTQSKSRVLECGVKRPWIMNDRNGKYIFSEYAEKPIR